MKNNTDYTQNQTTVSQGIPPLPHNAPGINGFTYRPQYGVVVVCASERAHMITLADLQAQGYKCKAVRV